MNAPRKKSAVAKYSEIMKTATKEEVIDLIVDDEKGYSEDEQKEIIAELFDGPAPVTGKPTKNLMYEEFKVRAIVSKKKDEDGDTIRTVTFEKDSNEPIRRTSITPDKAEVINSQSENTLTRLYEVK